MTDIPMIFSGPMVRALLDGCKTQTRRVIKLPTKGRPTWGMGSDNRWRREFVHDQARRHARPRARNGRYLESDNRHGYLPPPTPGRGPALGTREFQRQYDRPGILDLPSDIPRRPIASGIAERAGDTQRGRLQMASFDPYAAHAVALTLAVTAVKIEPLKDISETDALAEGCREPEFRRSVRVGDKGHDYSILSVSRRFCEPLEPSARRRRVARKPVGMRPRSASSGPTLTRRKRSAPHELVRPTRNSAERRSHLVPPAGQPASLPPVRVRRHGQDHAFSRDRVHRPRR